MEQKITWMHYLLTGISVILLFWSVGCDEVDVEYRVKADFVYKNETDYVISYNQLALDYSDTVELFKIMPKSEKMFTVDAEGTKNPSVETCCEGFLDGLQGNGFPILVVFDGTRCLQFIEGEGSTTSNILIYETESITNRHFKYTYSFTENDYQQAEVCE